MGVKDVYVKLLSESGALKDTIYYMNNRAGGAEHGVSLVALCTALVCFVLVLTTKITTVLYGTQAPSNAHVQMQP